jgi:hypothetical protein
MENTASEKLEKIRLSNAKRQQTFYEKNKVRVLEKSQLLRDQLKIINMPVPPVIRPLELNFDEITKILSKDANENTSKKQLGDIKRVFKLVGITSFNGSLEIYNDIKGYLDHSVYSLSTKRGTVQSILVLIQKSNIVTEPLVLPKYTLLNDIYTVKTNDANSLKLSDTNLDVILYTDYLKLILEKYGENSKQYLIARIYDECTQRDNFCLHIIHSTDCDTNKDINYLLRDDNNFSIILNKYKTQAQYGKQIIQLSESLCDLLTKYIDTNNLTNLLFPDNPRSLSQYIINMNARVGCGGINAMRKMKISEFLQNTNLTPEDRLDFAKRCSHSEPVQQKYRRGIKKGTVEPLLLEALK